MRVLLLARRAIPRSEVPKDIAFDTQQFADHVNMHLNQGLTVVGLVGLVDPPKVDTEETVTTLRGAYIRFMMVTVSESRVQTIALSPRTTDCVCDQGDFPLTAVAIAEQCGIVTNASTIHHLDDLDRDLDEEDVVRYDAHANRRISSLVLTGTDLMKMVSPLHLMFCSIRQLRPEIHFFRMKLSGYKRFSTTKWFSHAQPLSRSFVSSRNIKLQATSSP